MTYSRFLGVWPRSRWIVWRSTIQDARSGSRMSPFPLHSSRDWALVRLSRLWPMARNLLSLSSHWAAWIFLRCRSCFWRWSFITDRQEKSNAWRPPAWNSFNLVAILCWDCSPSNILSWRVFGCYWYPLLWTDLDHFSEYFSVRKEAVGSILSTFAPPQSSHCFLSIGWCFFKPEWVRGECFDEMSSNSWLKMFRFYMKVGMFSHYYSILFSKQEACAIQILKGIPTVSWIHEYPRRTSVFLKWLRAFLHGSFAAVWCSAELLLECHFRLWTHCQMRISPVVGKWSLPWIHGSMVDSLWLLNLSHSGRRSVRLQNSLAQGTWFVYNMDSAGQCSPIALARCRLVAKLFEILHGLRSWWNTVFDYEKCTRWTLTKRCLSCFNLFSAPSIGKYGETSVCWFSIWFAPETIPLQLSSCLKPRKTQLFGDLEGWDFYTLETPGFVAVKDFSYKESTHRWLSSDICMLQ